MKNNKNKIYYTKYNGKPEFLYGDNIENSYIVCIGRNNINRTYILFWNCQNNEYFLHKVQYRTMKYLLEECINIYEKQ